MIGDIAIVLFVCSIHTAKLNERKKINEEYDKHIN